MRGPKIESCQAYEGTGTYKPSVNCQTTGTLENPAEYTMCCVAFLELRGKVKMVLQWAGNSCREVRGSGPVLNPLTACSRCAIPPAYTISRVVPSLNHSIPSKVDTDPSSAHPTDLLPQPLKLRLTST